MCILCMFCKNCALRWSYFYGANSECHDTGHSAINNLCIKHRHLQCNPLFTTQYIKAIPPVLRRNLDIFVVFKFANVQSVVEQIYPEISGVIKKKILKLYLNMQH
jgi:hypothetical protein